MTTPILTIALPTYNRGPSITKSLESLARGLKDCPEGAVELYIRDNASTDETAERIAAFRRRHPDLRIRVERNETNLGYDRNHLLVYRDAAGQYLMFCSDRYFYDLDFRPIVAALEARQPSGLIFSDRFRTIWSCPTPGTPDMTGDDWLQQRIGGTFEEIDGWRVLTTQVGNLHATSALKYNWIVANVSDVIIKRDESEATLSLLESLEGTFMLVVGALLLPFRDPDDTLVVLPVPWFQSAFQKMDFGGQRHDNLQVAYGQVALSRHFPYIGTHEEIAQRQLRILLRTWLPIASGAARYERRYDMKDIVRFARDQGIRPPVVYELAMKAFSGVDSRKILLALNTAFEAAVIATRVTRKVRARLTAPGARG